MGSIFDNLESIREANGGIEKVGVKRIFTNIPVRKPHRQEFVRTHPDPDYRIDCKVLHLKNDNEVYFLHPDVFSYADTDVQHVCLWSAVTRAGAPFLWMLKLPDESGRENSWHQTAKRAAVEAQTQWLKVVANMSAGNYELHIATGDLGEPQWPDADEYPFNKWLEIAFKERMIDQPDHPVLQKLRGEI